MKPIILAAFMATTAPQALCTTDEHCMWLEAQAQAQGRVIGNPDAPNYVLPETDDDQAI